LTQLTEQDRTVLKRPLRTRFAYALGSWFGAGYSPFASGTVGSLATLPLFWMLKRTSPFFYVASTIGITAAGVWAAQVIAEDRHEQDPSLVVIDEVAGTLLAMGLVRQRSLAIQFAALFLFRVLDVVKPGPVSKAERLEPKGVGIMADDVLAGVLAGVLARLL
jgi:phosphatidylglycerophosphatase A